MGCDCNDNDSVGGNAVSGIALKMGFPLSTPCERANNLGAIPAVFKYPGFTIVRGGTVEARVSSGGIVNIPLFFTPKDAGCYSRRGSRPSECADCA